MYVCRRYGSDPALLWLWCRPAASAPIGPLAREPPYARSAGLKKINKVRPIHLLTWGVEDATLHLNVDVVPNGVPLQACPCSQLTGMEMP